MSDNEIELVLVQTMWDFWADHPVKVPYEGDRVFVRSVNTDPTDLFITDWSYVGVLKEDGEVHWINKHWGQSVYAPVIEGDIREGHRFRRRMIGQFGLEWGLFVGDGPEGERLADWGPEDDDGKYGLGCV